jgi:hypothetical protein
VYLPTTEDEALGIVGEAGATAELVYLGGLGHPCSPYYPDWKITDGCSVYYVNQQGELFDADADCDGYLISEGDCDDNNAAVNPGATEVCDGVDNDCDGEVDEGCPTGPSVIDHDCGTDRCCEQNPGSWCCDLGWSNVDNALVRDGACAVAESDGDAHITLDMGETKNSGTITVRCGSGHGEGPYFDGTTTVYGSADNSNWVTLGTFDIPDDGWDLTDYPVSFSDQQVRYVKVKLIIAECGTNWDVDSITWDEPPAPSVVDYLTTRDEDGWGPGWSNVNNALVRDGACAVAESDGYAYITLDMDETKNSGTITVRCASEFLEGAHFDGTTTIYGSADNSNWVTLGTFAIPEYSDLTDYTVSFSGQQVRYVKVKLIIAECGAAWSVDGITW